MVFGPIAVGAQIIRQVEEDSFNLVESAQTFGTDRDNTPPTALEVNIKNPLYAKVGQTLIGSYKYQDAEGDLEDGTEFAWYRSGSSNPADTYYKLNGANSTQYLVTGDDVGRFLKFSVIPKASQGASPGQEVFSSRSNQITDAASIRITQGSIGYTEQESNDGSVAGFIEATLSNSTFANPTIKVGIANLPSGLSIDSVERVTGSDITIRVYLKGNAAAHEAAASISDASTSALHMTVASAEMVGVTSNVVSPTGATISFKNNPVQNFVRHSVGHNRVSLSWDPPSGLLPLNSGLTAYWVYRNEVYLDAVQLNSDRSLYTDYSASSGINYNYQIRAIYGNSTDRPSSNIVYATAMDFSSFSIRKPSNPLESVFGLINHELQSIFVEMSNGTDISSLRAIFSSNPSNATVHVNGAAQTSGTTQNNFSSSHITPLNYVLKSPSNSSTCSYAVTVMTATTLSFPIPLGCESTTSSLSSTWFDVFHANSYAVDISTDQYFGSGTFVPGFENYSLEETCLVVPNLEPDTQYYFRVRAYRSDLSDFSNYSPTVGVRTEAVGNGTGSIEIASRLTTKVNIGSFTSGGYSVDPDLRITAGSFVSDTNNRVDISMGFAASPGGLYYRMDFSNPTIGNGNYVISYQGLPYNPTGLHYSTDGTNLVSVSPPAAIDTHNKTISFTIDSLAFSGKGLYQLYLVANDGSEDTLPLHLSTFTATASTNGEVLIRWSTEAESALQGFKILRGTCADLNLAEAVSPLIPANNLSGQSSYSFKDQSIIELGLYYYWLQIIELSGHEDYSSPIPVQVDIEIPNDPPFIPQITGMKNVYPNPFNPSTTITYDIVKAGMVKLVVYNNRGQKIRTLVSEHKEANRYNIVWDGKDDHGQHMPSGTYMIHMLASDHDGLSRITLLK